MTTLAYLLTCIYIVLSYISPAEWLPELAAYRPIMGLAAIGMLLTFLALMGSGFSFRSPQIYLLLGLVGAMGVSRIMIGWYGGAYDVLFEFGYSAVVFVFLAVNLDSFRKVRGIIGIFVILSFVIVAVGIFAYYFGWRSADLILNQRAGEYVITIEPRLRWYGFLEDPNDLAQNLLVALAFLAGAWVPYGGLRNVIVVIFPALFLLHGVYMTHSRGALIGLVALIVFLFKDRVGKLGAAIGGAMAFLGMLAVNFAGARGFGVGSGSGRSRLDLWSDGLGMFKENPLFGVGFGQFTKHAPQTAHNSFLLPLAELGLVGAFFWLGLITFTMLELNTLANLAPADDDNGQLRRLAGSVRLALITFLASGWFLSRSYIITFFLLVGMAGALGEMARRRGGAPLKQGFAFALALNGGLLLVLIGVVYVMVRSRSVL